MDMIDMGAWDYFKHGGDSFDALAKKFDTLNPCLKSFMKVR